MAEFLMEFLINVILCIYWSDWYDCTNFYKCISDILFVYSEGTFCYKKQRIGQTFVWIRMAVVNLPKFMMLGGSRVGLAVSWYQGTGFSSVQFTCLSLYGYMLAAQH